MFGVAPRGRARYSVSQSVNMSEHDRARRFTQVAFALAALAALAVAALIHHTILGAPLPDEARAVVTWSFVGLAALDALLLHVWQPLIAWICGGA